jgi:hypothetical protein
MKRFRRGLLDGLAILSLLLCVVTVALWIRSKSHYDRFYIGKDKYAFCITWDDGRLNPNLKLGYFGGNPRNLVPWTHMNNPDFIPTDPHDDPKFGLVTVGWFSWENRQPFPGYREYDVILRLWILATIFALLPAVHFRNVAVRLLCRSSKDDRGRCQVCGYDLRATPDRCPECGTMPPRKEAVTS